VYVKNYTLRGIGEHIEVWVASDEDDVSSGTDFPADDCRNGARTEITDEQVDYLIDEFDGTIYPKESRVFSVPPSRNGQGAELAEILGLPANYYRGQGDDIAVLVDNVRDENFYDTDNSQSLTYIAGFFADSFNELANRNVMTIDAFDWIHRTGANPPHEPSTDPCTSAPARPFLYEGVFAHEYQHLLEYYEDDGEFNWVNEGLSDWAQTLTRYVDPSIPIDELGYDSHVQCFLGYLGIETEFNPIPREGGPENSLTLWGDQTDHESEILCDYGAAYTFMEYLHDRYGNTFMGDLHRDDRHGLVGLRRTLRAHGIGVKATTLIDRWAASAALDGVLDDGARLRGANPGGFTVGTLDATVNWDTPEAYAAPGVPPNGSDYVRLRDGAGTYLSAGDLESLSFDGAEELPMLPIEWEVDATGGGSGDPALHSGTGDNLDRSIVREVDVPTGAGAELTFEGQWSLEDGFDYGYVQVSTDGGESYEPIACSDQVDGPLGPAFNGESDGFVPVTCDLSAWAGETVVLGFRLVTDGSVFLDGFWVDDVAVGGTVLSDGSTLDGWLSPTQYNPVDVRAYSVRLVGYTDDHARAWSKNVPLGDGFAAELDADALRAALGDEAETVAAIVTYHDPTETALQAAPYELVVNGVPQPGGGTA
jgi:Immune inhibitor A peptidase M6